MKFRDKLNKIDGNIYTIEEVVTLENGMYEAELEHDNVNVSSISVYTGTKLTGDRINTYIISTPENTPWRKKIRIYADVDTVYITYETAGDTVEAEDINRLQNELVSVDDKVSKEIERAVGEDKDIRQKLSGEIERSTAREKELSDSITNETDRAQKQEESLKQSINITDANLANEKMRAEKAENDISTAVEQGRKVWEDKYTKNEVDNKFSALETKLDWKEAVDTFDDLVVAYPDAEDGWTVNVKDTNYTYRYDGAQWIAVSANAIPKATRDKDGLLSADDKKAYDGAVLKEHEHANKSVLDRITSAIVECWNAAYLHISDAVRHITSDERKLWNTVSDKVEKEQGRGLSEQNYTLEEKNKLKNISSGAGKNVQSNWDESNTDSDAYIQNKPQSMPASGGNADTVNGYSVNADVPSGAKFTDTVYTHPSYIPREMGMYKVTVDSEGHVSGVENITRQDIANLGAVMKDTEIGGINLYKDTRSFKNASVWGFYSLWENYGGTYNGFTVLRRLTRWSGLYQSFDVKKDEVYTISFYARVTQGGTLGIVRDGTIFEIIASSSELKSAITYPYPCWINENEDGSDGFKRYWATLKALKDAAATNIRIENSIDNQYLYICGIKLEKGYVATEWTPSPYDMEMENVATATKLATARSINGASFDGTKDIQLPIYFSYKFGTTGNLVKYAVFCKMKKDNLSGEGETTMLLTAHGNFGGTIAGTYLVSISNRGSIVTMRVVALQQENSGQNTTEFGWYSDDNYFYCGVKRPAYSYSENVVVFSKSANFDVGIILDTSTQPTGWTKVETYKLAKTIDTVSKAYALDTSAGSVIQPVYFNGGKPVSCTYTLGKSVPADAVFTDTNTWREVINNLTSDRTDASLSALQGKKLKEMVDTLGGQIEWTSVGTAVSSNINTYNGYYVRHGQIVVFAANFWGNGFETQNARQVITGLPAPICWTALSTYVDAGSKADSGAHEAYVDVDGSVYMKNLNEYKTFISGCYICTA